MNSLTQRELVGFKPFKGNSKQDQRIIEQRKDYALYIREDKTLTADVRRLLVDHFEGVHIKRGNFNRPKAVLTFDRMADLDTLGSGYCSVVYEHPSDSTLAIKMFERYSTDVCCYEYLRMCARGDLNHFDWSVDVHGLACLKVFKKGADDIPDQMATYAIAVMPKYRKCSWQGNSVGVQNRFIQQGIMQELRTHVLPYLPQTRIDLHWGNIMYDVKNAAYIATDPVILEQGDEALMEIPFPTKPMDFCRSLRPNETAGKYINQLRQGVQHGRVW